jgi:hypothetical protein
MQAPEQAPVPFTVEHLQQIEEELYPRPSMTEE